MIKKCFEQRGIDGDRVCFIIKKSDNKISGDEKYVELNLFFSACE